MKLSKGMHVAIHSYKHNKRLHRIWKKNCNPRRKSACFGHRSSSHKSYRT
jgi:protein associated with RNAse G/E